MTNINSLSTAILKNTTAKLAAMIKSGTSRSVKYLKGLLKSNQFDKLDDMTSLMQNNGVLPKGKYLGKAPFRGEENTIHLWTGDMGLGDGVSTFAKRGVSPSLLVEKSPLVGGLYTSPEKHKATLHMYKNVANSESLIDDFLPFSVRTTPNRAEAASNAAFSERIFQPFVRDASAFQKSEAADMAAPLFRRGRLRDIVPSQSKETLNRIVRSTPIDRSTLDITDLKPDNFVNYRGKVQLADATPSSWIYDSPIKKRLAEALPFSARRGVAEGRILNPGLFMESTPAQSITHKLLSSMAIPAIKDMLANPTSFYRVAKKLPLSASDMLAAVSTNTRLAQNIGYASREAGGSYEDIMNILGQLAKEISAGANLKNSTSGIRKALNTLSPEESKLLSEYLGRRSGIPGIPGILEAIA